MYTVIVLNPTTKYENNDLYDISATRIQHKLATIALHTQLHQPSDMLHIVPTRSS